MTTTPINQNNPINVTLTDPGTGSEVSLGQQISADSVPVVLASDQPAVPVSVSEATPTIYVNQALAGSVQLKSGSGVLYGYDAYVSTGAPFVTFYDSASAPTVGSTTNLIYEMIQGPTPLFVSFDPPIPFSNGLYIATATTMTGNTAPSTGVLVNVRYK